MSGQETDSMFQEVAIALVKLYKAHIYPREYDKIVYQDNMRIRLTVAPYKTVDDTQPVYGVREDVE